MRSAGSKFEVTYPADGGRPGVVERALQPGNDHHGQGASGDQTGAEIGLHVVVPLASSAAGPSMIACAARTVRRHLPPSVTRIVPDMFLFMYFNWLMDNHRIGD